MDANANIVSLESYGHLNSVGILILSNDSIKFLVLSSILDIARTFKLGKSVDSSSPLVNLSRISSVNKSSNDLTLISGIREMNFSMCEMYVLISVLHFASNARSLLNDSYALLRFCLFDKFCRRVKNCITPPPEPLIPLMLDLM